jgi:hypothetical protein
MITGFYNIKTINEFGHFDYYIAGEPGIYTDEEIKEYGLTGDEEKDKKRMEKIESKSKSYLRKITFAFQSNDSQKIYDYSGKEMISKEFKDYKDVPNKTINGQNYGVVLEIDLEPYKLARFKYPNDKYKAEVEKCKKELEKFSEITSEKFSVFKTKFYGSVILKMLDEVKERKKDIPTIRLKMNTKNEIILLPSSDRMHLIYGIDFEQPTDQSLVKVIIQEFKDAMNHINSYLMFNFFDETSVIPKEIENVVRPKDYSNNLVVFDLTPEMKKRIEPEMNMFIFFKEYIQFHVHSIKSFLHIKMKKKEVELTEELNNCKIIPEDYIKNIKEIDYLMNKQNQQGGKIFNKETEKVQV